KSSPSGCGGSAARPAATASRSAVLPVRSAKPLPARRPVSSAVAAYPLLSSSLLLIADARVGPRQQNVGDEVAEQQHEAAQHQPAQHQVVVVAHDALIEKPAEARIAGDDLGQRRAAQQARDL